jgi:hypothetical protein
MKLPFTLKEITGGILPTRESTCEGEEAIRVNTVRERALRIASREKEIAGGHATA